MLSKQYSVEDLMRPIIDYIPTAESPPQAPKHITAAPTARVPKKPKVSGPSTSTPTKPGSGGQGSISVATTPLMSRPVIKPLPTAAALAKSEAAAVERKARKDRDREEKRVLAVNAARAAADVETDIDMNYDLGGESPSSAEDDSAGGSPSRRSSSSRSASPIQGSDDPIEGREDGLAGAVGGGSASGNGGGAESEANGRKRKFAADGYEPLAKRPTPFSGEDGLGHPIQYGPPQPQYSHPMHSFPAGSQPQDFLGPERYEDTILDYFITETSQIPEILVNPPADYDPNSSIDDDGHTALHWACAMGRIRVVKLLLAAGADIFRVNHSEQTPLMRSVMFSNNYDVRKFPELYELLHRSTLNIDKNNRTVFHHIADVALSKGKTHAARYYMETILGRLAEYPKELGDVVNFQDDEGETAITLAARARSKRLVKALLDHGADPKLANRDGKTAEDYILEDERFRSSPIVGGGGQGPSDRAGPGSSNGHLTNPNYINHQPPGLSHTGQGGASSSRTDPLAPPPVRKLYHSHSAQLAAGKTSAEIANLLATLARSYDDELQTREREIGHANGLLTTMQTELSETRRQTEVLRAKLGSQLQDEQVRLAELEKVLELKMERDYALGWSEWHAAEAAREAAYAADPASVSAEDQGDLAQRLALPTSEAELETEQAALARDVEKLSARRRELFGRFVALSSGLGTGEQMGKYRRIIQASAGGQTGDMDEVMVSLLEVRLLHAEWTSIGTSAD